MSNQSFSWNPELTAHFNGAPELALLDLDGTLINSIPDLTIATDNMLAKLGLPLAGTEKVSHWVGNGIDKLVRRALANGVEEQALALSKDAVSAARVHFDAAYLDALTSATGAYPGVEEWLNTVTIPKVLITNKARVFTEPIIESLGWNKHFVQIICGDDLADKKPSPLPLLHACKTQGIAPERAFMVGDSRNDIQAARAAGMVCVAVSYGYNHGEDIRLAGADWLVDNLLELLA